jgi:hypothetical protein
MSRALPGHTLSLWFTIYHSGLVAMYPWLVMFS